jgi:hypothetical protein
MTQKRIYKPGSGATAGRAGHPGTEAAPGDLKTEWLAHFTKAICPSSALAQLNVPIREPIMGKWFKQGDLGFVYGERGLGKTWLAGVAVRRESGCF